MDIVSRRETRLIPKKNLAVFKDQKLLSGVRGLENIQKALGELNEGVESPLSLQEFEKVTTYLGQELKRLIDAGLVSFLGFDGKIDNSEIAGEKMTGLLLNKARLKEKVRIEILGLFCDPWDDEDEHEVFNPSIDPWNDKFLQTIGEVLIILERDFRFSAGKDSIEKDPNLVANLRGYLAEIEEKQKN